MILAMKLPSAALLTCLIISPAPSLRTEMTAPAIGLPLLSRTDPLTVATRPDALTVGAPAPETKTRASSAKPTRKFFLIAAQPPGRWRLRGSNAPQHGHISSVPHPKVKAKTKA